MFFEILSLILFVIVLVNFIAYLFSKRLLINKNLWRVCQLFTVAIIPFVFLIFEDLPHFNSCCGPTAHFSPDHRFLIYLLIFIYTSVFIFSVFRKSILTPLLELFLNSTLVLGLLLNILFLFHFKQDDLGGLYGFFGNTPIILILFLELSKNQKLLKTHIDTNNISVNTGLGKIALSILNFKPLLKYPVLLILVVPIIILLSLFLILFGQKPDSLIKAFTDTYYQGFSQLDYMCDNIECGGHFLCSVGANGHSSIVKPIRYGERNGNKIICNRQLLISNAFEELLQEKLPKVHKFIRNRYNKVGNVIHRYYHIFNLKFISDIVYILMKPLEFFFLFILYLFDLNPENRISAQYLNKKDKHTIKSKLYNLK